MSSKKKSVIILVQGCIESYHVKLPLTGENLNLTLSIAVNSPGSSQQPIPVVAVSPQPKVQKSHIDDFAGVSIIPTSAPQDYESKIDWSKATITPQPSNKSGKFRKVS